MAATKAAARHTNRGEPTLTTGNKLRRGRELPPAWLDKLERDTGPLSMDEVHAAEQARKLPLDTDPDDIADPDERRFFVKRLQAIDDDDPLPGDELDGAAPAKPKAAAKAPRSSSSSGKSKSAKSGGGLGVGTPTLTPPRHLSVSDGSGFALGLVLYALALNYLRHGWPGVTGWLRAKFLNEPMGGDGKRVATSIGSAAGQLGAAVGGTLVAPKPAQGNPKPQIAPPVGSGVGDGGGGGRASFR